MPPPSSDETILFPDIDDEIEVVLDDEPAGGRAPFRTPPAVVQWLGEAVTPGGAPAYVMVDAMSHLIAQATQSTTVEVGGILLGTRWQAGGPYVIVTGVVAARGGETSATHLTFTAAHWQAMLAEQEQAFPGTEIVGWYHTHPGYGIFLSAHDEYVHRHFFAAPHQVAVILDPVSGQLGMFSWQGEMLVRWPGLPLCEAR
jgi:proteasome lid subunit RPN8/RPN11